MYDNEGNENEPMNMGPDLDSGSSYGMNNYGPPAPSPVDTAKEFLQKNGKSIVIILVVALVGFLVYDYLIGSLVKTTLTTTDTEGKTLGIVDGMLYEGSSTSPLRTFSGSITLDLRPGEYRVEYDVTGTEYADPGVYTFNVSPESKESGAEEIISLEKENDVQIESVNLPGTLVAGQQNAAGTVLIRFGPQQEEPVELILEGAFEAFDISTQPSIISGAPNTTIPVSVFISVPSTVKVTNTKTGDSKTGSVRVKYTNVEKNSPFTLFKTFALDVNPKTPQTFAATANKLYTKTFTLKNNAGADMSERIQAEVTIKSAQENNTGEIAPWFTWSPTMPFEPIVKGASVPVQMQLFPPAGAMSDVITGEIKFYTGFWSQIIPFTLNLTEAKVELKATIDNAPLTKTYTVAKNASGTYEVKNALLRLENAGVLPIENILFETGGCDEYITLLDTSFFFDLVLTEKGKTGSTKTTTLQITAPQTALPGSTQNCLVQLSYLDPKTGDVAQNEPINVVVETK